MLQVKLESEIYKHISETGRECKMIIVHPNTWVDFVNEITEVYDVYIGNHNYPAQYRGIKILRSSDLLENTFEIR